MPSIPRLKKSHAKRKSTITKLLQPIRKRSLTTKPRKKLQWSTSPSHYKITTPTMSLQNQFTTTLDKPKPTLKSSRNPVSIHSSLMNRGIQSPRLGMYRTQFRTMSVQPKEEGESTEDMDEEGDGENVEEGESESPPTISPNESTETVSKPSTRQPELRLTLFTPTMAIADRLPIRYVRFQTLNEKTVNVYARLNNGTYQIAPGRIFFAETGLDKSDGNTNSLGDETAENDPGEEVFETPFDQDTILTPQNSINQGFKHHLYFTSGGIAVKRKSDIVISALQLVHPQHIDREKVEKFLDFCDGQSHQVVGQYEFLRSLGTNSSPSLFGASSVQDGLQMHPDISDIRASVTPHGLFKVETIQKAVPITANDSTSPSGLNDTNTDGTSPESNQPTTQSHLFYHQAHPSMEYAMYDPNSYITSVINDVAIAMDTTLQHMDKMTEKTLKQNEEMNTRRIQFAENSTPQVH